MKLGLKTTRARQVRGPGGHARVPARSGLARSPTGALTLLGLAISAGDRHGRVIEAGVNNARIHNKMRIVKPSVLHFLASRTAILAS